MRDYVFRSKQKDYSANDFGVKKKREEAKEKTKSKKKSLRTELKRYEDHINDAEIPE